MLDPREDDTLRHEVAELLQHWGEPALADDLTAILAATGEGPRFRAFAAQHLGIAWQRHQAAGATAAVAEGEGLRRLLDDRDEEVRREALLPLAQQGDALALARATSWLEDPARVGVHDLCLRVLAEAGRDDCLPAMREHLSATRPELALAAVWALAVFARPEDRPLVAETARRLPHPWNRSASAAWVAWGGPASR